MESLNGFLKKSFHGFKVVTDEESEVTELDPAIDAKLQSLREFQQKGVRFSLDEKLKKEKETGETFKRLETLLADLTSSIAAIPKGDRITDEFEAEASIFSFAT